MAERAILYGRVSTEEQGRGYSLPTQLEGLREYAEEKNYFVVGEFIDMHTGTELDRPGLNDVYQLISQEGADILVVYDLDRLSREVGNQAIIEMEMSRAGVRIEYVLGQYADTPEGELMKLIKAGIAQYENRQRVERSRRGKIGRVRAGYVICPRGRAPFGYDYKSERHKGWFVINEREAEVVRNIYHWIVYDGLSSYMVAKTLWEQNILTKGDYSDVVHKKAGRGEWSPATIRRIVTNDMYKGMWYYGKTRRRKVNGRTVQQKVPRSEWISLEVPAIVDENLWEQAQQSLVGNKQNAKRNRKREYLLSGMIVCTCGRKRVGIYKNHLDRAYYRCRSSETQHWVRPCDARYSYRQEVIEKIVWDSVAGLLLNEDNLRDEIDRRKMEASTESEHKQQRLAAIRDAISDVDRKLGILLDQVLQGGFAQSVIDEKRNLLMIQRRELEGQESRIQEELRVTTITMEQEFELTEFAKQVAGAIVDLPFETKRRVLELIQLRVDVISPTQVRLSGVISDGLIVDISSA